MKTNIHFGTYFAQFLQGEILQTEVAEKIKTHTLGSIPFF